MNGKRKGKDGELEAARLLRFYGYNARRGVQYKGGADSPDVVGIPGAHIEVKRTERTALYDWIAQAKADSAPDEIPVVMHRKNRAQWLAILSFDDFMKMYKVYELYNEKENGQ